VGSRPDEMNCFNIPNPSGPGVHSASNRHGYQQQKIMFLGSKVWQVHRAANLASICELIV
jgi:hypothetical protein